MTDDRRLTASPRHLRAGDVVEILSSDEIRATLDAGGALGGLPFMPEMWPYCGRRFRVFRTADKVCVEGTLLRRLPDAVFLTELRCDGADHDGCDRACLLLWKTAWLKRADGPVDDPAEAPAVPAPGAARGTRGAAEPPPDRAYSCQSTSMLGATVPLSRWDVGQYVRDVTSGNFGALHVLRALFIVVWNRISRVLGRREFGVVVGTQSRTPVVSLGLQPGELVEVRSRDEIAATVDGWSRNRGLVIDYEMLRHAGRRFRVFKRVDRMILETTGKMRGIQNTVLLEGTACEGLCRRACARNTHPMWREAWLKRVEEPKRG